MFLAIRTGNLRFSWNWWGLSDSEEGTTVSRRARYSPTEVCTYSLCTRWLRRSWVTCSCHAFLVPVAERGAAVGMFPMELTDDPSDSSWLEVEQGERQEFKLLFLCPSKLLVNHHHILASDLEKLLIQRTISQKTSKMRHVLSPLWRTDLLVLSVLGRESVCRFVWSEDATPIVAPPRAIWFPVNTNWCK